LTPDGRTDGRTDGRIFKSENRKAVIIEYEMKFLISDHKMF